MNCIMYFWFNGDYKDRRKIGAIKNILNTISK